MATGLMQKLVLEHCFDTRKETSPNKTQNPEFTVFAAPHPNFGLLATSHLVRRPEPRLFHTKKETNPKTSKKLNCHAAVLSLYFYLTKIV